MAAASAEIKEGIRISLDWPLDKPSFPAFDRQRFEHEILNRAPMTMNDDAIHINTQSSTQWDGFRHYGEIAAHFREGLLTLGRISAVGNATTLFKDRDAHSHRTKQFYNGHTQKDFEDPNTLGIQCADMISELRLVWH